MDQPHLQRRDEGAMSPELTELRAEIVRSHTQALRESKERDEETDWFSGQLHAYDHVLYWLDKISARHERKEP